MSTPPKISQPMRKEIQWEVTGVILKFLLTGMVARYSLHSMVLTPDSFSG